MPRGRRFPLQLPRTSQSRPKAVSNEKGHNYQALRYPCLSHLKMLRFLKKHRKSSKQPTPLENPTHQITDTEAECGGDCGEDPEGEYRLRERSELMRPMGLIRPWHQIPVAEGVLRSQIRTLRSEERRVGKECVP